MALDFDNFYDIEEQVHEIKELVPFDKVFKEFDKKACMNGKRFVLDYSFFSSETVDFIHYHFYACHQLEEILLKEKYHKQYSYIGLIMLKEKYHKFEIEEIEKIFKDRLISPIILGKRTIYNYYPFVCDISPAASKNGNNMISIYFEYLVPNEDLFN